MSKEAMKLDDKAVAQILSRLPSPPVGDGSALHAWAMQVVRKLAEQSVPVQPDETLLSFYQATDFPSLVSAMNGHIKKMQSKLQSNPHTAIDAWNNREMVAVEHCIWARNGNTPCPHTSPQPAQQEPVAFIDMSQWPPIRWRDGMIRSDVAAFDGQPLVICGHRPQAREPEQPAQAGGETIVQTFTGLPRRKLRELLAGGWEVNGVCFQRTEEDGTVRRGAATIGGMVIWWNAEQPAQKRPPNCGTGFCSCIECVMEPKQPAPTKCWKCGDADPAFTDVCQVPACGMREQP